MSIVPASSVVCARQFGPGRTLGACAPLAGDPCRSSAEANALRPRTAPHDLRTCLHMSCACSSALLHTRPSPHRDSTPTLGTSPKHSTPTPTRVRAEFRPDFPPQVSSAASTIPRRRQRSGRPNPVCPLRSNIKSRPEGTKSLEHPCVIFLRELRHFPPPAFADDLPTPHRRPPQPLGEHRPGLLCRLRSSI